MNMLSSFLTCVLGQFYIAAMLGGVIWIMAKVINNSLLKPLTGSSGGQRIN